VILSIRQLKPTEDILIELLNMRKGGNYQARQTDESDKQSVHHIFQMGDGGAAAEIHLAVEPNLQAATQGIGGCHHLALRVPDDREYQAWFNRFRRFRVPSSGQVDRYYFQSLYFREPNGILFELATDGPGFTVDEPEESLGENLSLPPDLEKHRLDIETSLEPLVSGR
jgi:glyoxalase family protein